MLESRLYYPHLLEDRARFPKPNAPRAGARRVYDLLRDIRLAAGRERR